MNCDMCGKQTDLYKANIEGAVLFACKECASYGEIIGKVTTEVPKQKQESEKRPETFKSKTSNLNVEPEIVDSIVTDFHLKIKNKREKLGLKQEELAKMLNEKLSLIQQIESKKINLSIDLAKKIERQLGLKLIEQIKQIPIEKSTNVDRELTLADMANIKIRKRK